MNRYVQVLGMRALPVILLLVASLMAGCTGGDDDDPPTGGGGGGTTPPPTGGGGIIDPPEETPQRTELPLLSDFALTGCEGARFLYPMDPADAEGLLPEGYTAALWETTGTLPIEQVQRAQLRADLYNCTSFTAGQYAFDAVWFGYVHIPVEPPADARDADSHAYILQMVAGEDVMGPLWRAAQYPTHNGTTGMEDFQLTQRYSAGDYSWDVAGGLPGQGTATGSFTWYHELDNGDRLTWTGQWDIPAGNSGPASLVFPSDAPFAGVEPIPGQPLSGEGTLVTEAIFDGMDLVKELAEYRE